MKKVVLSHRLHEAGMSLLAGKVDTVVVDSGKPAHLLPALLDAAGLILRIGSIDRETMLAAKQLAVIGRPGVGVDDVDIAAATELGIPVVIAPGANTRSVAEHALALIFSAAKDILRSDRQLRRGNFAVRNSYKAVQLQGKTLGLIGFGHIGSELAGMAKAIGLHIIVYDPFVSRAAIEGQGYGYEPDLETVLAKADIVSLHVPLNEKTRNLIGDAQLRRMKPSAILINCARGGVVDEPALAAALAAGRLHSAALDVLADEPPQPDNPLLLPETIIVTPHMAGLTQEAAAGVATMAVQGVLAVLRGEIWPHVANPLAYEHEKWREAQLAQGRA
ncbi:MAG: hydroxyacid dehydrogenase [Sporomusaceae bacterium]|nr:hydroxyacid dehydrogenase [Sporomusaceae bacterium]